MNKCILLGRLTKDPDIRYSQNNNIMVANFTLAVNRKYVKPGEERQTDFINIVAYSKLAEFINKYINKGLQVCVSGRLQTRNWDDDNGNRRYVTEVIAEEIDFADSQKKSEENTLNTPLPLANTENNDFVPEPDDLPF